MVLCCGEGVCGACACGSARQPRTGCVPQGWWFGDVDVTITHTSQIHKAANLHTNHDCSHADSRRTAGSQPAVLLPLRRQVAGGSVAASACLTSSVATCPLSAQGQRLAKPAASQGAHSRVWRCGWLPAASGGCAPPVDGGQPQQAALQQLPLQRQLAAAGRQGRAGGQATPGAATSAAAGCAGPGDHRAGQRLAAPPRRGAFRSASDSAKYSRVGAADPACRAGSHAVRVADALEQAGQILEAVGGACGGG